MRVIARRSQPNQVVCAKCGCTIEYDEHDLIDFEYGYGFMCPDCHERVYVEKWEPHQFPESFHETSSERGSVKISQADTQEMINEVAKTLQEKPSGEFTCTCRGDTMVLGLKYWDADAIIVAKNYWEEEYNFRD